MATAVTRRQPSPIWQSRATSDVAVTAAQSNHSATNQQPPRKLRNGILLPHMSSETLKRIDAVLRAGEVVGGHYRADHLIAQGGMAAVWAGQNLRTGKKVALKVIRGSFAGQSVAIEMFRRESIAASKINHPSVVSIFDVIDHNHLTLIVMELLHGESLAEYLVRKGPLNLGEALMLLLPAMRGVEAAHAHGVIHRDLKPGNIFLCEDRDGSLLTTKVLDFGICKVGGRGPRAESDQIDLARFGTPAYMSPEDIAGANVVDGRVDVYGFGILLFESLTGQLPFTGPGLELLEHILYQPAPKLRSLRPELPVEIEDIVDCALAKLPDDRFPDVAHLLRAIEDKILAQLAVPRAPMPAGETSSPFKGQPTQLLTGLPPATQARLVEQASLAAQNLANRRTPAEGTAIIKIEGWHVGVATAILLAAVWGLWVLLRPPELQLDQALKALPPTKAAPAAWNPPPVVTITPSPASLPSSMARPPASGPSMMPALPGYGLDGASRVPAEAWGGNARPSFDPGKPSRKGSAHKNRADAPRAGTLSASDF